MSNLISLEKWCATPASDYVPRLATQASQR